VGNVGQYLNILSAAACVCSILFALSLAFARSGQIRLNFFFLQTEARQTPERIDLNCFYQGDCNELRSTPIWASIQKNVCTSLSGCTTKPVSGESRFCYHLNYWRITHTQGPYSQTCLCDDGSCIARLSSISLVYQTPLRQLKLLAGRTFTPLQL
jgi:hypothetical protein